MHSLSVEAITVETILAVDAGSLRGTHDPAFDLWRSEVGWLELVGSRLEEVHGDGCAVRERPEVALATLKSRGTFASLRSEKLFPLRVDPPDPELAPLRIGARGSLSIRTEATQTFSPHAEPGDVVAWYYRTRGAGEDLATRTLRWFVGWWNTAISSQRLDVDVTDILSVSTYRYEIVDMNAYCRDAHGSEAPIKTLYDAASLDGVRGLAGLSRMARKASWSHYSRLALENLRSADLGNRVDEIWIVNQDRILRSFGEGRSDPDVAAFLRDVDLAVELVCQERATLGYLADGIQRADHDARRTMGGRARGDVTARRALQTMLHDSAALGRLLGDPLTLRREAKHSFLSRLIGSVAKEIGAVEAWEACRAASTATSAAISAELSLLASEAQLELAHHARRTNRGIYVLTLATLLVALVALVGALTESDRPLRLLPSVEGRSPADATALMQASGFKPQTLPSCARRRGESRVSVVRVGPARVDGAAASEMSFPEGTLVTLACADRP